MPTNLFPSTLTTANHLPPQNAIHMQAHALEARVPQVRALDDPMLMTTTFLEPIQTAAGPQDVILNLSRKVPWFGKRALRGEVAIREAQATFARMAAAQLGVVEQVKLAYYELFPDVTVGVNYYGIGSTGLNRNTVQFVEWRKHPACNPDHILGSQFDAATRSRQADSLPHDN